MKFLIIAGAKEAFLQSTGSVIRQMIAANRDIINRQKEEGKVLDAYFDMEGQANVMICQFDSAGEMWEAINELPASGLWDWTIKPLIDWNEAYETILKNMEKGDEIMPGGSVK